jgi:exodeoxyribonuclease V alpha subunit
VVELSAVLTELIFTNPENGYTVALFENPEEDVSFTGVGILPFAREGRRYRLSGDWEVHKRYGEQFSFTGASEELPTTADGIEAFLASGMIRGIGPKTAKAIVSRFGDETLKIIENEPARLAEVSGIGPKTAAKIVEGYARQREFANVALWFETRGIAIRYAKKCYDVWGKNAPDVIQNNPYQLVDEIVGVGFRTADALAAKLGFDRHSEDRLAYGSLYVLNYFAEEGNTYYPLRPFCERTAELLEVSSEEVGNALRVLALAGRARLDSLDGETVVYPELLHRAETRTAAKLLDLEQASIKPVAFNRKHPVSNVELSEKQWKAVELACLSGVCVITGGPGTGKTTIINTILGYFERAGLTTAIAAPTGRAAKRITETSGRPASTIHRLLEYVYSDDDKRIRFGRNAENPLEADAVICDESSMIDIQLMDALLQAISPGTRLILVGDANQLPSVGPGNVLRDILASDMIPSIRLTEIFRQAAESLIVVNAHKINNGEYPDLNEREKDFFFLRRKSEREMLSTILDLVTRRLPAFLDEEGSDADPLRDIQLLTPVHKGLLGTENLNRELQSVLNPPDETKREKVFGNRLFREGDKVMQTKNDYELTWKRSDDFSEGEGVFNGDLGTVVSVDPEFNEMTVVFDDVKYTKYDATNLEELELAYAVTVHKSQGSEFPVVVMPMTWFPPFLATRNLFYTAVTRAKKLVVLVGSADKMHSMIDNNAIRERYSGLAARLKQWEPFR